MVVGGHLVSGVTSLVQLVVAARVLGRDSYGAVATILAIQLLTVSLFETRTDEIGLGFLQGQPDAARGRVLATMLRIDLLTRIASALVFLAAVPWMRSLIEPAAIGLGLFLLLAASPIVQSIQPTARASLLSRGAAHSYGLRVAAFGTCRSLVVSAGAIATETPSGLMASIALASCLESAMWAVSLTGSEVSGSQIARLMRRGEAPDGMYRLAFKNGLAITFGGLSKSLDSVIVAAVGGVGSAADYRVAKSISGLPALASGPAQTVLVRRFTAAEPNEIAEEVNRSFRQVRLPLTTLAGLAAVAMPVSVFVLFGPSFRSAAAATLLLGVRFVVYSGYLHVRPLAIAKDRLGLWGSAALATTVGTVGLGAPLVNLWGATGMAVASTVVGLVGHAVPLNILRRSMRDAE